MNPQKQTPLLPTAQAAGAEFTAEAGWQIAAAFGDTEVEVATARHAVALVDCSNNGKILLEGQGATAALHAAWQTPSLAIGEGAALETAGATAGATAVFRLRDDLYFISAPPGQGETHLSTLEAAAQQSEQLVTVTDVTHGRSELHVIGPQSAELLSRLCGLDFHPTQFPNGTARQSRIAKTNQIIIRRDLARAPGAASPLPAYALVGGRSLAAYLWQTILEAGRDLGIAPIGRAALDLLNAQER